MKSYFSQYGAVTRVAMPRNKVIHILTVREDVVKNNDTSLEWTKKGIWLR